MNRLEAAWDAVERRATKWRRKQIEPLRTFLREIDNPHARVLSGRPVADPIDESSARALETWIVGQYRNHGLSKIETAGWLGLTHAAIVELVARDKKLKLPQTRLAAVIAPDTSPFAPDSFKASERVDHWRDGLHAWLRQDPTNVPLEEWQAAIVLSAVLHGALLDTTKLKALLDRMGRDLVPDTAQAYSTFSFDLPYQGLGNHHLQRWIIDPLTEMLVWRCPKAGGKHDESKLDKTITRFLISNRVKAHDCPTSLRDLVQSAVTWWSQRGTQIEIHGSTRRFTTHAFHPRSWARINGVHYSPRPVLLRDDNHQSDEPNSDIPIEDMQLRHHWLWEVANILNSKSLSAASIACKKLLSNQTKRSISLTYVGWLDSMLSGESSSRDALALSTIRRRVGVTVPRLLSVLGDDDPAKMDTKPLADMTKKSLEEIYSELTSDAEPSVPIRDLANGLRDFHAYLVRRHKKEHISKESEVLGDEGSLLPVDANLPTYDEYEEAQVWLNNQLAKGWHEDEISICKLVMMLAFKAGLRRMEIFGLRLEDIHTHKRLIALLRPNAVRRLKTKNSKRVVPLFALLNWREQQLLREWICLREKEEAYTNHMPGVGKFLFKEFYKHKKANLSWVDRICERVCKAIVAVTHDDNLFMHHFRHAFATWTYLRLRAPDFPMLVQHFDKMPATTAMLRNGRRLRILLLGRSGSPSRSYPYAIARLLGHSSPAVSMAHYVHAGDLVLGAIVWRECEEIPDKVLTAASGLSNSAAYAKLKMGLKTLVQASRDKHARPPSAGSSAMQEPQTSAIRRRGRPRKAPPHLEKSWIEFETLFDVLTLIIGGGKDADYVASDLNMDTSRVQSIVATATRLGPLIGLEVEDGRLTKCPLRPRGPLQKVFMDHMEIQLADLASRAPAFCADGLTLHLEHFNQQRCDVVFTKKAELPQLRRYLRFLEALDLKRKDFQWVVRLPKAPEAPLPSWCSGVHFRWSPEKTKRTAPTNHASSFAKWVGVRPIGGSGAAVGRLMATAIFLAHLCI